MGSFLARLSQQQQFSYVPHTSVSGETWQKTQGGETTSAGAANGTTIVDTNLSGNSADDLNGRYWVRIVEVGDSSQGAFKRVIDDNGSGTLTLEGNGFDAQIGSSVKYELWLSPEPVVVIDSSSGETNAVDAVRAEADDFWIDYYLVPITGTHLGKLAKITDFVSSTGTFTLESSFGSALAAGDVCLLRKYVDLENPSSETSEAYIRRPGSRVLFGVGDGVVGPRSGSISFSTQIRPSGSPAGADSDANASELSGLFQSAALVETVQKSVTVGTNANATSAIKIVTGDRENVAIGGMVSWNGNESFIESLADGGAGDDTMNIDPPFPGADGTDGPADGDVIVASRMYAKSTDGDNYGVCIEYEMDGVRLTMTGCKGNAELIAGDVPTLNWTLNVDHWIREAEAAPYNASTAYSTSPPVLESDRLAYLDATKTNIKGFTATLQASVTPKGVQGNIGINGRSGFQLTGYQAGGTWRELLDASSATLPQEARWRNRTAKDLKVVYGNGCNVFGVRMPVARLIQVAGPADADGMLEVPNVFEAQDAGTALNGTTITKVPDFSFHIT